MKLDSNELILFESYGKILVWIFKVINTVKKGTNFNELSELQNQYLQFPDQYLPDKKYIEQINSLLNKVTNWVSEAKSVIENSDTPLEHLEKLYDEYKQLCCKYDIGTYIIAQIEWLKEIKPKFSDRKYVDIKVYIYIYIIYIYLSLYSLVVIVGLNMVVIHGGQHLYLIQYQINWI